MKKSGYIVPYTDKLWNLVRKNRLQKSKELENIQTRKSLMLIDALPLKNKIRHS